MVKDSSMILGINLINLLLLKKIGFKWWVQILGYGHFQYMDKVEDQKGMELIGSVIKIENNLKLIKWLW